MRLEKETFGPVLRAARERRGVTLRQLAAETKLSVELWEALEDNNLARWPKRVFARSYVRDYAERIGLDPDEVVNEFCRLFPEWGDRRAERVIREKAKSSRTISSWEDLPAPQNRRSSDRAASAAPGFFGRHRTRLVAIAIDASVVLGLGFLGKTSGFALLAVNRPRRPGLFEPRHPLHRPPVRPRRLGVDPQDAAVAAGNPPPALLAHRKRVILPLFCPTAFVSDILSLPITTRTRSE